MFRTITHLVLLGGGFFGGIYVGVHHPNWAQQADDFRQRETTDLKPKIDAAVAAAKIELLKRLQASSAPTGGGLLGGSGFAAGGSGGGVSQSALTQEMQAAQSDLQKATGK